MQINKISIDKILRSFGYYANIYTACGCTFHNWVYADDIRFISVSYMIDENGILKQQFGKISHYRLHIRENNTKTAGHWHDHTIKECLDIITEKICGNKDAIREYQLNKILTND